MASLLNSSNPPIRVVTRRGECRVVYFARQGKGLFAPISEELMMSTKNFWMVHYVDNEVSYVTYVKRDKHHECKTFAQCKNNLPKGINSILFLMGLHFKE